MKCKPITWVFGFIILVSPLLYGQSDSERLNEAKLHLFDKEWLQALKILDTLADQARKSEHYPMVLFWRGKCHEELRRFTEALRDYDEFLALSKNPNLIEEANRGRIDIYITLYRLGEKKFARDIIRALHATDPFIQYYTAIQISYLRDKKLTSPAVPVLKNMILEERNAALVDRAKIALMRIDPDALTEMTGNQKYESLVLRIRVFSRSSKKESLNLNIPFVLANVALNALPDETKGAIEKQGFKLDKIIGYLVDNRDVLKFIDKDTVIHIWIEKI